jgi:hypothetical protein
MGSKRFSMTTPVLVIALLGTLYGVGHLVNPPPPKPPEEESKNVFTPEQEKKYKEMQAETERKYREQGLAVKGHTPKAVEKMAKPSVPNPVQSEISDEWANKQGMGKEGLKQLAVKSAADKKKFDEYMKSAKPEPPPSQSPHLPPPLPSP